MKRRMITFLLISGLAISAVNSPVVNSYLQGLKQEGIPAAKQIDPLFIKIGQIAPQYELPASDAKIDKVWKAIPGYNGVKVDIPASYKKMQKLGKFDEKRLIFKQTAPKIHLKDLPAAPIYRGNPDKPAVAFIINVAWGNEYLSDMLAVLKRHNIEASFFLEGNWVKKNPDLAKIIASAGHEIGNHSYSHPDMGTITPQRTREEIIKTNEVIEAVTNITPKWFGPPSGSMGPDTVRIADELKLGTVLWTIDTIDWQKPAPEVIISRVTGKLHNGAMILMHPTDPTAKSLERLIVSIKKKEIKIISVSELLSEERIISYKGKNALKFGEINSNR